MSRPPNEKFVLLFEAAKRSFLMAEILVDRLRHELAVVESLIRSSTEVGQHIAPALLSCVAFVDFAHRFGELVDQLPLLRKDAPETRKLRAALMCVEDARHHLQHLRGDLSSNDKIDYPLLGSISWISGDICFMASLSQPNGASSATMAYDSVNRCWVAKYQYRLRTTQIDPESVLAEMRNTFDWIISKVTFTDPNLALLQWGKTQCIGFILKVKDTPADSQL